MKTNLCLISKLLAGAAFGMVICVTAQTFAQNEIPLPSTVMRLTGNARASNDGGRTWKKLKVGNILPAGLMIQTAKKSDLDILLGEQVKPSGKENIYDSEAHPANFVSLAEDTLLKIDKLTRKAPAATAEPEEEILLDLRSGAITANVKPLTGESKYEVGFPTGVVGTRGGIYKLRASGEMSVQKGTAFIALANGPVVKIPAGQGLIANSASPEPPAPVSPAVAPAPKIKRPPTPPTSSPALIPPPPPRALRPLSGR